MRLYISQNHSLGPTACVHMTLTKGAGSMVGALCEALHRGSAGSSQRLEGIPHVKSSDCLLKVQEGVEENRISLPAIADMPVG